VATETTIRQNWPNNAIEVDFSIRIHQHCGLRCGLGIFSSFTFFALCSKQRQQQDCSIFAKESEIF
jgi:hypothetical protein